MTLARAVRAAVWIVVLAAILDPEVPVTSRSLPRIAILYETGSTAGEQAVRALRRSLGSAGLVETNPSADADAFVLIADRYPLAPLPTSRPVHVLSLAARSARGVTITRATAPARALLRLPLAVTLDLERAGAAAERTTLQLIDRDVVRSAAEVAWLEGQRENSVTLTYVPTRPGSTRLRITAGTADADVLTEIRDERFDVRAAAPRASWALTFAAAALQEDDRLTVSTRIATSRGRAVSTSPPRAAAAAEAPDVLLQAVDEGTDADALRRVADRGAVVVLLPTRGLPAALQALTGVSSSREHVARSPLTATNELRASEWLLVDVANPAADIRASVHVNGRDYPAVIDLPVGSGRVVLVTALDAWRYRGDAAYGRFWRGLVVEAAARQHDAAARLRVTPAVVRPGEPVGVTYHATRRSATNTITARVAAEGNDGASISLVRTTRSTFAGRFHAPPREGIHRVELTMDEAEPSADTATFVVARDAVPTRPGVSAALEAVAAAHGGTFANASEVGTLASTLARSLTTRDERVRARPMRWPGWTVVFAALLGVEWWARRRNGLR